jgi:hypothetical protein
MVVLQSTNVLSVQQVGIVHQNHQSQLFVLLVIIAFQIFLLQNLVLTEPLGIHLSLKKEGKKIVNFATQNILVMELV